MSKREEGAKLAKAAQKEAAVARRAAGQWESSIFWASDLAALRADGFVAEDAVRIPGDEEVPAPHPDERDHVHLLDNPPQPEAADMREEGDGAPIPPAPAVGEGASQPLDGEAASHSAKGDDEDQVPLSERYKRSRSSTPVAADESSSPGVAGEALGAPAVVPRPSRDGRKRLKIGLALRPMAAGARDRSAATAPSGLGALAPVPPSSAPGPDPERMSTPLSTPPESSAGAVPASGPSASPSSSAPAMSAAPYALAECTLDKEGLSMADKAAYFDCMTQQPLFKVCERVLNEVDRYRAGRDEA